MRADAPFLSQVVTSMFKGGGVGSKGIVLKNETVIFKKRYFFSFLFQYNAHVNSNNAEYMN